MTDNIQITEIEDAPKSGGANASFTPAQLDLGLLVDNPTDDLFEQDKGNMADDEDEKPKQSTNNFDNLNTFNLPPSNDRPNSAFNVIDKDELESVHGDDNSVIMSDGGFPKISSDEESHYDRDRDRDRESRYSRDSRDSYRSHGSYDSEESLNKRRKMYMQMKQYCRKKNIEFPSHLRPDSPYHELKSHMSLLRSEYQMEKSVQMCKKMLVSFASVFEFVNGNYLQSFGLEMDGWSEHVNDNKDEYDEVFEELYEKYQDKVSLPPEMRLIMMIGGSAASYHVMNSMSKRMSGRGRAPPPQTHYQSYEKPYAEPSNNYKPGRPDAAPRGPVNKPVSDPDQDENEDIQDILRQIKQENQVDDLESLSSTATSVRRKRANKSLSLDAL